MTRVKSFAWKYKLYHIQNKAKQLTYLFKVQEWQLPVTACDVFPPEATSNLSNSTQVRFCQKVVPIPSCHKEVPIRHINEKVTYYICTKMCTFCDIWVYGIAYCVYTRGSRPCLFTFSQNFRCKRVHFQCLREYGDNVMYFSGIWGVTCHYGANKQCVIWSL